MPRETEVTGSTEANTYPTKRKRSKLLTVPWHHTRIQDKDRAGGDANYSKLTTAAER